MGSVVEEAVRTMVVPARSVDGLPQVVRPSGRDLLVRLLRVISGPGQVPVEQGGKHLVGEDGRGGAGTDAVLLPAWVIRGEQDAARGNLRFIDRRYRLRMPGQA